MNITYELTTEDMKKLILEHFQKMFPTSSFEESNIKIMVKSKQNFKSEWEEAAFKVILTISNLI